MDDAGAVLGTMQRRRELGSARARGARCPCVPASTVCARRGARHACDPAARASLRVNHVSRARRASAPTLKRYHPTRPRHEKGLRTAPYNVLISPETRYAAPFAARTVSASRRHASFTSASSSNENEARTYAVARSSGKKTVPGSASTPRASASVRMSASLFSPGTFSLNLHAVST
jgi:hypothetical protein